MKKLRICLSGVILILILLIFGNIASDNSNVYAQNSDEAIYAVSNYGEILDFNTLAQESAQSHFSQAYSNKMMPPVIPSDRETEGTNASFLDQIIGEDNRIKISNTISFPWSTVVKIRGNFDNFTFFCTGWMLGPSTVVTSAHCIYDYQDTKKYASNVTVIPALNSDAVVSEPFGVCESHRAWINNLWVTTGDKKYDYGVYALRCRVGELTGNLGYRVIYDSQIINQLVTLTGYPVDKGGTTMWSGLGTVNETMLNYLLYSNDSTGQQSGAPVWELINDGCETCVVAIHSGEHDDSNNAGVRITNDVFNFLFLMQQYVYDYPVYLPIIINGGSALENMIADENSVDNAYPAPVQEDSVEIFEPYPAP